MLSVAIAVLAAMPALFARIFGWQTGPIAAAALFGTAILAAGFLLSWSAEAAEHRISQGLVLAGVALITVLPEYAVDIYYAYQAGRAGPSSPYVHYAAANMTGANRLLIGIAWPLLVLTCWIKNRQREIALAPINRVELGFLLLASLYAFLILAKRSITVLDFIVLLAVFAAYVWRVRGGSKTHGDEQNEEEEPGPAAALALLEPSAQWAAMGVLGVTATAVILVSAEPFAQAMVAAGRALGINEFLLIQWLAPLASEAPTITIAILYVLAGRASSGLVMMVSEKINQWTLLVGMLPLAMTVAAGAMSQLPLDARQSEEFFLTAAQSVFGITLLLRLRLTVAGALALAGLFFVQVGLAFGHRNDEGALISSLTFLAWVYLGLAAALTALNVPQVLVVAASLRKGPTHK